jgi:hypothetical protein
LLKLNNQLCMNKDSTTRTDKQDEQLSGEDDIKKVEQLYSLAVQGITEYTLRDSDIWYSYVINLPIQQQVVYTIAILDQQVLNGGFHQYFFNSYGQFAFLTLENLELIGAKKTRAILAHALTLVNNENDSEEDFRRKVFNRQLPAISNFDEELMDQLEELDDEYYPLKEDWVRLVAGFVDG